MVRSWVGAFALLGLCGMAGAAEGVRAVQPEMIALPETSPLLGGWIGSIGGQKVVVCFTQGEAHYFYARHWVQPPLDLVPQDAGGKQWRETLQKGAERTVTGNWLLNAPAAGRLGGEWQDPSGKKSVPIALEKQGAGAGAGCDLTAMLNKVGRHPERIEAGNENIKDGIRYRTLSAMDGTVSTIELIDAGGKYGAFNNALRENLAAEAGAGASCQQDVNSYNGYLGWSYESRTELTAIHARRWATLVTSVSAYCGGAHPNDTSASRTVDMLTGEPVRVHEWVRQGKDGKLPRKLIETIGHRYLDLRGAGDDCGNIFGEPDANIEIALGRNGLVFSRWLPRVIQACGENVEIPFEELRPYLTEEGKRAVRFLLEK